MKIFFIYFVLLCILNINAYSIGNIFESDDDIKPKYKNNIVSDIKYGGSSEGLLDIYYDKNNIKELKPVVIFIHGGGWITGDKSNYEKTGKFLSKDGYVAVLPNYILLPKGSADDMVNDIYQSIQWVYKNIKRYGGNKNKISLVGYSAGAHLLTLTTIKSVLQMKNNDKFLEPLPKTEKLVLFNCPFDFDDYNPFYNSSEKSKNENENENENGIINTIVSYLADSNDIGPTDILQKLENNSIKDFGFPKMTIYHGGKDSLIPENSTENFIKQMHRVSHHTNVNEIFQPSYDHDTLVVGAKDNEELRQMFLNIIKI